MDKKKILIIVSIVLIVISIVISIFMIFNNSSQDDFTIDGIGLPENEEILKDTVVDSLKITDVSLLTREGVSMFKATVTNESDSDISIDSLKVIFYIDDKDITVNALMNSTISTDDYEYINITSEVDLSRVSKIEYVLE